MMEPLSRRQALAAGAVTVSLPMLERVLHSTRTAAANATLNPAAGGARGGNRGGPAEKPGWFATTLKPSDLKEGEFTAVAGHAIALSRKDNVVLALSNKCTHQGCALPATPGSATLSCPCHGATYRLDGSIFVGPAKTPLNLYAVRLSDKGFIEIDPGSKPAKPTDTDGSLTVATTTATAPAATAPAH